MNHSHNRRRKRKLKAYHQCDSITIVLEYLIKHKFLRDADLEDRSLQAKFTVILRIVSYLPRRNA